MRCTHLSLIIVGWLLIVSAGCKSSTSSGGSNSASPTPDKELILGAWLIVHAERDGEYHNDPVDGQMQITFTADRITSKWLKSETGHPFEATYTLDGAKQPKEIDLNMIDNKTKRHAKGIYVLQGDDLTICFGEQRPTEMKTRGDENLIKLKRVK